jgi:uncharacterized membrane protein YeiH
MEQYNLIESGVSYAILILGTISFAISGAFSAMQKRLDAFGVLIVSFITSIGGGTIRDILIGETPVTWMKDLDLPIVILLTSTATLFFKKYIKGFKVTLFLFDALGLGLFTLIGIQKGVAVGLHPAICLTLGTITGCFGGVLRDVLLNNIPLLFRKEIYATACVIGGAFYLFLSYLKVNEDFVRILTVVLICGIRIVSYRLNLSMPKFYDR